MGSALSYGISRVPHYSGFTSPSLGFHIQDFHLLWSTFPGSSINLNLDFIGNPNPINITIYGLGSSSFARHYLRNRYYFLFLWVLRCFSSPRSLLTYYFTHMQILEFFLYNLFCKRMFAHNHITMNRETPAERSNVTDFPIISSIHNKKKQRIIRHKKGAVLPVRPTTSSSG